MMRKRNESGFSLLELTVAILLTVGMLGAVFALMNRNQQVYVGESNVTDMDQNMRVAIDLLTRDIQSAGMGMPRTNGCFAAIYYTDGASGAPDKMMIFNGDPYAPAADVSSKGTSSFSCFVPPDVTSTGSGTSIQFSYLGKGSQSKSIYKSYSNDPRYYVCYDDSKAMVLSLTSNGTLTGSGSSTRLNLPFNTGAYTNPPTAFGSAIDKGEPDYTTAKIAMLGSLISYRLNTTTRELERTEDLVNWYTVARGITNFQVKYRVISKSGSTITETVSSAPTTRRNIRAVVIEISGETPDLPSTSQGYRQVVQQFEVAPRNFSLLNNSSLSTN